MEDIPTWAKLLIQGGFAGMCAVMLVILFWIIRKLMSERDNHFKTLGSEVKSLGVQVRAVGTQVGAVETMTKAVDMKTDAMNRRVQSLPCNQHADDIDRLKSTQAGEKG